MCSSTWASGAPPAVSPLKSKTIRTARMRFPPQSKNRLAPDTLPSIRVSDGTWTVPSAEPAMFERILTQVPLPGQRPSCSPNRREHRRPEIRGEVYRPADVYAIYLVMKAERLAAGALVLLFAAIYGLTLLPGIGPTGDNIKFQYVGRVLGVPHATGYPLYLVLNHLFTAPPLKSVAFRANLMSAVFAVLTLVFLFLALSRLTANAAAAFVASSFFGLTATFWSQAVVAEVYTLTAFFLALILWSLLEWRATGRDGYFLVFLCAYGLSLGNHLTVVACLPAALVFVLLVAPGTFRRLKFWLFGLAALVVGVGQYGLLFLRTAQEAPYLEHEIRTLNDLVLLVTGHQFRSQMFAFSVKELLADRIPHFIRALLEDITWPGLTLALAGLVFLFLRRRKVFVLCFLAILVQSIWILSTDIPDVETHMIPVSLICSLAAGFGLTSLMSLLR
ncbi:MAG: DUF2723 domain-containing protein, partial [Candidatus Aminicenantes bacterium]|nr:DUF2723 domain-containing protein [Candidatus Aminicenantes bacterium]